MGVGALTGFDAPASAPDFAIREQILNLPVETKKEFGFSCLLASGDLSDVGYFPDTANRILSNG